MFCHKCGTKIANGAAFCHKCGAKVIVDTPVGQSAETLRANLAQQPIRGPMNVYRKKKSRLPIIPGVGALAVILIILGVIGSKIGSSTSDGRLSDGTDFDTSKVSSKSGVTRNNTIDEVLYNGIPVSQLIGASPDEVIDSLGDPLYEYEGSSTAVH